MSESSCMSNVEWQHSNRIKLSVFEWEPSLSLQMFMALYWGGGVVYSSREYNKKFEVSTKRNADH